MSKKKKKKGEGWSFKNWLGGIEKLGIWIEIFLGVIELVGVLHLEVTEEVAGLMTVLPAVLGLERLQPKRHAHQ